MHIYPTARFLIPHRIHAKPRNSPCSIPTRDYALREILIILHFRRSSSWWSSSNANIAFFFPITVNHSEYPPSCPVDERICLNRSELYLWDAFFTYHFGCRVISKAKTSTSAPWARFLLPAVAIANISWICTYLFKYPIKAKKGGLQFIISCLQPFIPKKGWLQFLISWS